MFNHITFQLLRNIINPIVRNRFKIECLYNRERT